MNLNTEKQNEVDLNSSNPKPSKHNKIIVGRRKRSVARVLIREGKGFITVNKKKADDYFYMDTYLSSIIKKPLALFNQEEKYDISVIAKGGGFNSQAEAASLGVSRFLSGVSEDYKKVLRKNGMLTRDSRKKEREKPGKLKARKSYAFVKR